MIQNLRIRIWILDLFQSLMGNDGEVLAPPNREKYALST